MPYTLVTRYLVNSFWISYTLRIEVFRPVCCNFLWPKCWMCNQAEQIDSRCVEKGTITWSDIGKCVFIRQHIPVEWLAFIAASKFVLDCILSPFPKIASLPNWCFWYVYDMSFYCLFSNINFKQKQKGSNRILFQLWKASKLESGLSLIKVTSRSHIFIVPTLWILSMAIYKVLVKLCCI